MRVCVWFILPGLIAAAGCVSPERQQESPRSQTDLRDGSNPPRAAREAARIPASQDPQPLFDGKSLKGWRISDFAGRGEVRVDDGKLVLEMGTMTGVTYTNPIPTMNYEISLEAMRVDGTDFFCALTFPVGNDPCSLIVGGWGGGVVGLSSLDGQDAANNETTQYMNFEKGRWYRIRLRVIPDRIQAWIDEEKAIDADTKDRRISIRIEVEESRPLGIASWSTTAALRNIQLRRLN
ncbi:MAG: DUF1080 domain-containing protein [Verrucomicrobia subdivision 3 bacterium]|nr:DUF1080 domain-containing protein [Limisphaerales bacterium]